MQVFHSSKICRNGYFEIRTSGL